MTDASRPDLLRVSPHLTQNPVWVFTLDLPAEALGPYSAPTDVPIETATDAPHGDTDNSPVTEDWPLPEALGWDGPLDPAYVDVFPADRVAGLGLTNYLTEGLGVQPDSLSEDRSRLNALIGGLVLITPRAVEGGSGTFAPTAPLRFVGAYPVERAAPAGPALHSAAASEAAETPPPGTAPVVQTGTPRKTILIGLAVVVVLLLLIWAAL
ncbi:MAG: hypothetical protein ABNH26_01775 [Celeribacter sp.]|jgi:hypothetical protein